MTVKEFSEDAEITVEVKIFVNGEEAFAASTYDINGAIEELGNAERHHVIQKGIESQYESLPEPIEDESRGLA